MNPSERSFRTLAVPLLLFAGAMGHAESPGQLDEYRGRVVYLDFWASWCTPCLTSFPWMQALENTYKSAGLAVIAVNLDRHRTDAEHFLGRNPSSVEVRFDPQGQMAQAFHVKGMPTSFILDRHGVVRFTHIGFRPMDGPSYEAQVKLLLAEQ